MKVIDFLAGIGVATIVWLSIKATIKIEEELGKHERSYRIQKRRA